MTITLTKPAAVEVEYGVHYWSRTSGDYTIQPCTPSTANEVLRTIQRRRDADAYLVTRTAAGRWTYLPDTTQPEQEVGR